MLPYDRLVVAAGSHGFQPPIPGLADFGHSVNDRAAAVALDKHLQALADRPASPARDTVVVVGGGFTGIEVATELHARLPENMGEATPVRMAIVDTWAWVAGRNGEEPRA